MPIIQSRIKLAAVFFCALATACKSSKSQPVSFAIPDGSYHVSPITCASTGRAPEYPDITKKALLLQFDFLVSHTVSIQGGNSIERFEAEGCTLTFKHEFYTNEPGKLSYRDNRKAQFEPADCQMIINFEESTFRFGLSSGLFPDRDKPSSEEVPFIVETIGSGYRLKSAEKPQLQELWTQYGCGAADQITFDLTL